MKSCLAIFFSLATLPGTQAQDKTEKKPAKKVIAITDKKDAGIDYQVQGEYVGDTTTAAQVLALGGGKFDVFFLTGGLPGAGWDGKTRVKASAQLDATAKTAAIKGAGINGTIKVGDKTILEAESVPLGKITLTHVLRKSPTLDAKPPQNAAADAKPPQETIVLFDGTNASEWKEGKITDHFLGVPATSKRNYKLAKLHLEFVTPFMPYARGQGRGNSGVYLYGREIQVLDSFALESKKDECGAIYGQFAPLVNMCYPPLSWQTYDFEVKLNATDAKGKKAAALLTVYQNGVKIQDDIPWSASGNIHLQNHGNPVFYRNIWLTEAK